MPVCAPRARARPPHPPARHFSARAPAQVPALTAAAVKAGALTPDGLVRYVGMVQDIFDPELYATALLERDPATGEAGVGGRGEGK